MSVKPILIDVPIPIVTDRLILRAPRAGDGAKLHDAKAASFNELARWMPWARELGSVEDSEEVAREACAKFIRREDLMLLGFERLKNGEEGDLIVSTGLHRMDWNLRIFEIGYWVRSPNAGNGYATETTNALLFYAFNALAASKVRICHAGGNDASRRVIEKLGFEKEGVLKRDAILPDGTITDHHWYARFDDKNLPELKVTW